ncbi:MAG: type VI secretion system tip protein VgrG [Deltaproteobacteria bacterium]|jgi:type VI secretion system secreted protein VgrG|nr:type VI secretion system tip protein VgrG [Deltaproteobacteria bacterium]MBW2536004.1 type VI secretion system tip protein VgrG [Deltaproteobacteria bacterium]
MPEFATLAATSLGDNLRVVAFRGTESLCRPYRFDIHVMVSSGAAIDLAAAVGSRATLLLQREDGAPFKFHGVLGTVRLLVQTPQWSLCQATLVPLVWRLSMTRHSNAFTEISLPELIEKVLQDSTLTSDDFELRLDGDYEKEELIVQYKESNLDFLHRWMEHEGLYYFFEQGEDREKLIIVDHRSYHDKLVDKRVRYYPLAEDDGSSGECFDTFMAVHNATVERVRMIDYDYMRPALDVSGSSDVSARGFGEQAIYGGRVFDPDVAARFAQIRAEELQSREVTYHAAGTPLHVCAGYLVELEEHPVEGYNRSYLVTQVHHFGNQVAQAGVGGLSRWVRPEHEEMYRVEAAAVGADLQYRPPLTTQWPRVWGLENGIIDGPADSEYAQIDEEGRYRVKFHFDESDLREGKASTYVRMMQPHGGTTEGFHFPLRKNTEVVFTFLGGDPDRPVIVGVVPNAHTPSPITKENYTKNMIKTGAGNHITIDDAKGKEFIHLFTPKLTEMFMGGPTDDQCAETQRHTFVAPPEDKAAATTQQDVSTSFYLFTDQNAGFNIQTEWWQTVSGDMRVYAGGLLLEQYVGPHTFNVTNQSDQYYGAHLKVEVAASEDRDVTGQWDLFASEKAIINSPEFDFDATSSLDVTTPCGTLNFNDFAYLNFGQTEVHIGDMAGDIASVDISIPNGAKISTPNWEVTDPNHTWYGALIKSYFALDTKFGAIENGVTAVKREATGVKMETFGLAVALKGAFLESDGTDLKKSGANATQSGIRAYLSGFTSFT